MSGSGVMRTVLLVAACAVPSCTVGLGATAAPAGAATTCVITAPANITVGTPQGGATVNYPAPTTTGTCGTITCSPASGGFYPVGTSLITCATNGDSPNVKASFLIRLNDTGPPALTVPSDVTVNTDPGKATATPDFALPVATDPSLNVVAFCTHAPKSAFLVGTTTVACTARDGAGNAVSKSFKVTVLDKEAPVIGNAPDVSLTVGPTAELIGTYATPVVADNADPAPTISCTQPSGSPFPLGASTVTCTAKDAAGNVAAKTFTVTLARAAVSTTGASKPLAIQAAVRQGSSWWVVLTGEGKIRLTIDRCTNTSCSKRKAVATVTRSGVLGLNVVRVPKSVRKTLTPGRYRATITADTAKRTVRFTIPRR